MNSLKLKTINFFSKKSVRIIIIAFFALQIIINILSLNIEKQTFNLDYYSEYSKEHNIKDIAGVSQEKLESMYSKLILYTKYGNESLLEDFNERETMHMKDVHELYNLKDKISLTTLTYIFMLIIIFCGSKEIRYQNLKYLLVSLVSILLFCGIIGFLIYLDFDTAFIKFHEIFFNNDLWLLDPKTDIMIRMLPQDYFMNVAYNIFKGFIIEISITLASVVAILIFGKFRHITNIKKNTNRERRI